MEDLEYFRPQFIRKMALIKWEAGQWIQYIGFKFDEKNDTIILTFKSSTYGITFEIEKKAFSSLYGEPHIPYTETYQFFRGVKYSQVERS